MTRVTAGTPTDASVVPMSQEELVVGDGMATGLLWKFLELDQSDNSLVDRIVLSIARDIIEGRIEPGATLDSISLSEQFRTSRTPVREALVTVERHGLIEVQARRRARVRDLTRNEVEEIYELRAELHSLLTHKAVSRRTEQGLKELESAYRLMERARVENDIDAFFWSNIGFHESVASMAQDATLHRVTNGLGLQSLRLRRKGIAVPGRVDRVLGDHERLVAAFHEGDADLAAALSRSIVMSALLLLRTSVRI